MLTATVAVESKEVDDNWCWKSGC